VSLVGAEEVWLVGRQGIDVEIVPRDLAFCSHTVAGSEPMVVMDLQNDPRFANNALVRGEDGLRFYVGAPFLDPGEDLWLGAVCAVGQEVTSHPTREQREALKQLSRTVLACLK
jgi:GAF domain-containing protein